jgi:DNA segregation ATPase FtsK/SpoIIIE, S-DNA-T family
MTVNSHAFGPGLSIRTPVHLGIDEAGRPVTIKLIEMNKLLGGEPGGGKSNAINLIVAHAALSLDCRLILIDGKQVEFGLWRHCADEFNRRYALLLEAGERKVRRGTGTPVILVAIDEVAYFSATVGDTKQQKEFSTLLRDVVARGRAAGVIVVAATQRPSSDIIPTSLRDLFAYRWAFRCTTKAGSDTILGQGWATAGYSATDIDIEARGVGWLLAEGGTPKRIKAARLSDGEIKALAAHAAHLRAEARRRAGGDAA